ncbi:hypothetical protein Pr1d_30670 [Bythopirellula goksoeyrii]|uniref:Uncharacterized protein n=1 Tax=Bythopirellula goksoeyrii TaxID=1400387 RepID=A0A5B9QNR8_9BACT|nr:hypothetical protein Pr1d_30670 [Bythopirellula goksoeyrii]
MVLSATLRHQDEDRKSYIGVPPVNARGDISCVEQKMLTRRGAINRLQVDETLRC